MTQIVLFFTFFSFFQSQPTGSELLLAVDANMTSSSRIYESEMTIHTKRNDRVVTSKNYVEGTSKSYSKYLSPARDKGTKMLKIDDQLWIYSPSTDRIIQLSGHMLRQSVMGSDMSYEDMMDDRKLIEVYNATVIATEKYNETNCYKVELLAKVDDVAYHKQVIWIDTEKRIPLKQEMYAKSGQLLKRVEMYDVQQFGDRYFPTSGLYKDMLKSGKGTEFKMRNMQFDVEIPEHIFSKASLKK